MHKHLIIGLGWLGSPLAMYFKSAGHTVAGTTRNTEKVNKLTSKGIQAILFDLYENEPTDLPHELFKDANVIVNIPPGRRNFEPALFIERMKGLFDYAHLNSAMHICFISTTSVFGMLEGRVSNNSPFSATTASGGAHVTLERYLKELARASKAARHSSHSDNGFSCAVLRLAGLVGKDRHPITTLSQKSNIAKGKDPVNLIHREDVIQAISVILQHVAEEASTNQSSIAAQRLFDNNFYAANLCSLEHPSREQYYTWCAEQKSLRIPEFFPDNREKINGKWIDAKHTISELGLELRYPSPFNMLE